MRSSRSAHTDLWPGAPRADGCGCARGTARPGPAGGATRRVRETRTATGRPLLCRPRQAVLVVAEHPGTETPAQLRPDHLAPETFRDGRAGFDRDADEDRGEDGLGALGALAYLDLYLAEPGRFEAGRARCIPRLAGGVGDLCQNLVDR